MGVFQTELCPHRPGRWTELEAPCGEEGWWGGVQGREGEGCFILVSSRRARLLWGRPSALPLTLCRPCPCCVLRGRLSAPLSSCPVFAGPRSRLLFPPREGCVPDQETVRIHSKGNRIQWPLSTPRSSAQEVRLCKLILASCFPSSERMRNSILKRA